MSDETTRKGALRCAVNKTLGTQENAMTQTSFQDRMLSLISERSFFEQAKDHAYAYMDGAREQSVYPSEAALTGLAGFDEPLAEEPGDPAAMLRQLHELGSPATTVSTGGRYFGFVTGGVFPPVVAARWLADAWDQNAALHVLSPVTSKLEAVAEKWLLELLGLPAGCVAGYVGGTSTATAVGLASARQELLRRQGWDVNAQGLFGAPAHPRGDRGRGPRHRVQGPGPAGSGARASGAGARGRPRTDASGGDACAGRPHPGLCPGGEREHRFL